MRPGAIHKPSNPRASVMCGMPAAYGKPELALRCFNAAIAVLPDPDYALQQAADLGNAGHPALGVRHLDAYAALETVDDTKPVRDMPGAHRWLLRHYGYYRDELARLRAAMAADAAHQGRSGQSNGDGDFVR